MHSATIKIMMPDVTDVTVHIYLLQTRNISFAFT